MIEIKTKIHDRYSIEMKMGFLAEDEVRTSDFTVGMWLFVPRSLDVTPMTFTSAEFYRCVKSNVRLITPHFRIEDIADGEAVPLKKVLESSEEEYDYRVKVFCAIVKSSLRDSLSEIEAADDAARTALVKNYVASCRKILEEFFPLRTTKMKEYCGEYLCHIMSSHLFKLLRFSMEEQSIKELLKEINATRLQNGYPVVKADDPQHNRDFIHRQGVLKKLVDSEFFLRTPKKRDGVMVEQVYYSLAAGLAMIFATVVAWAFQKHFGNLTWPLFIALIISYMMKDRIKELMRYYFAHRVNDRYYDNKARMSVHGNEIGWIKEAMDFIPSSRIPADVKEHRNRTHLFDAEDEFKKENVILYRKGVHLDKSAMKTYTDYDFEGINDIVRIQVRPFLRKMDNPVQNINVLGEDDEVIGIPCEKDYFINIILKFEYSGNCEFKRFRIALNRDGIKSITPVE